MRKAFGDVGISELPSEVRRLWYSRDQELEPEEFISMPYWMPSEPSEPLQSRDLERVVAYVLLTLAPREAFVLTRRFWFEDTLEECGRYLEVGKERIRQIEAKAIRKLKHPSRTVLLSLVVDLPNHYIEMYSDLLRAYRRKKLPDEFVEWLRENPYKKVGLDVDMV